MRFEWDEAKNRRNVEKHGISFARASGIFDDVVLSRGVPPEAYGEQRAITIGRLHEEVVLVLTVVHTQRGDVTRIISARPASRRERRQYEQALRQAEDGGGTGGAAR